MRELESPIAAETLKKAIRNVEVVSSHVRTIESQIQPETSPKANRKLETMTGLVRTSVSQILAKNCQKKAGSEYLDASPYRSNMDQTAAPMCIPECLNHNIN